MQRIWRLELIYYWRKCFIVYERFDYVWNLCLIQEYYIILCDTFIRWYKNEQFTTVSPQALFI